MLLMRRRGVATMLCICRLGLFWFIGSLRLAGSISGAVRVSCILLIWRWLLVRSMLCGRGVMMLLASILIVRMIRVSGLRCRGGRLSRSMGSDCWLSLRRLNWLVRLRSVL